MTQRVVLCPQIEIKEKHLGFDPYDFENKTV